MEINVFFAHYIFTSAKEVTIWLQVCLCLTICLLAGLLKKSFTDFDRTL